MASFDSTAMVRAILQAGVGMTLLREEQALQGEAAGCLTLSPIARAEYALYVVHLASRKNAPDQGLSGGRECGLAGHESAHPGSGLTCR